MVREILVKIVEKFLQNSFNFWKRFLTYEMEVARLFNTSLNYGFSLYLYVSTRAVIGQFSGPYYSARPAKI